MNDWPDAWRWEQVDLFPVPQPAAIRMVALALWNWLIHLFSK